MTVFALTHPSASVARGIENLILRGENSHSFAIHAICAVASRAISLTIFPLSLLLELTFRRIPKLLLSIGDREQFHKKTDKIGKFALGILFAPFGLHSADSVSSFFLKSSPSVAVRPFGVEQEYGRSVDQIYTPKTTEELQSLIQEANREKKQVSIIGAGMSQGLQTVPRDRKQMVIHTKHLNQIEIAEDQRTVTVGAGATWEQVQIALNREGKSVLVKQASDIFSIGGSIGINCHGWAHEIGAIASTVESLEVIDAEGNLRLLTPNDEYFRCMFGTLGYFGVIVKARLKITENELLIKEAKEVELDQFIPVYEAEIKGKNIPLFGGRLVLDNLEGDPLRKVCMVSYKKTSELAAPLSTHYFTPEPKYGTRFQQIGLHLIENLSHFSSARLLSWFWAKERAKMLLREKITRNEALHPPINAFAMLHHSHLHAQWLQEYFLQGEHLANFLRFLGAELKANQVRLINATIRPVPRDSISILPYAEQNRFAVVICFAQLKTEKEIAHTRQWIERVNQYLAAQGDVYYQPYMPYATREQFEQCYGKERVEKLRALKVKYDPNHLFGNSHTERYFDRVT